MCDLKLLPSYDTPCSNLIGLYLEPTVFIAEQMSFLSEYPWQDSNDCPAQKTSVRCCIAPVKETVFLLRMAVNIAVNPYMSFLVSELFEKISYVVNFGMEFLVRCNPLAI